MKLIGQFLISLYNKIQFVNIVGGWLVEFLMILFDEMRSG